VCVARNIVSLLFTTPAVTTAGWRFASTPRTAGPGARPRPSYRWAARHPAVGGKPVALGGQTFVAFVCSTQMLTGDGGAHAGVCHDEEAPWPEDHRGQRRDPDPRRRRPWWCSRPRRPRSSRCAPSPSAGEPADGASPRTRRVRPARLVCAPCRCHARATAGAAPGQPQPAGLRLLMLQCKSVS
jgi:hypothetical protein